MALIDKLTAHYREKLGGDMRSIYIPEMDETIYFKPINGVERDAIMKKIAENKFTESQVETLIQRARNADGTKCFSNGHRFDLMNRVDPNVISRIVEEMGSFDEVLDEGEVVKDAAKKS